ncbi:hypothetical protein N8579_00855 [bacterium]|jgi:hypothetical protein|nr:hypothetical protein [bacterium]
MIDKNKLFDLFDDSLQQETITSRKSLDDFIKSPFAKIGMFTKLILNHFVFHEKLKKFLNKEQPSYNSESTREAADFTIFNRSWHYIKDIDIEDPDSIEAILNFNPKIFNKALQSSIMYFENCEQYERCAHLVNIQQIVKRL